MKFLFTVLYGLYACTNVQSEYVASIDLGPVHGQAQIGNLTEKYYPLTDNDTIATYNAIHFAEWSRDIFKTGFGPLPAMDPYKRIHFPNLEINSADGLISGNIGLTNLEVTGSKNFTLEYLAVLLNISRVDVHFDVPEYEAEVDFDAELVINQANIDLQGHLSLTATDVAVKVATQAVKFSTVFQLEAVALDIQAGDVQVSIQNSDGSKGNELGIVNSYISDIFGNATAKAIVEMALLQSNDILKHFTIEQVLAALLPNN